MEDPDRPGLRIFLEVYRDQDALQAHETQPHVRAFLAARSAHLAEPIEVERLQVAGLASVPTG